MILYEALMRCSVHKPIKVLQFAALVREILDANRTATGELSSGIPLRKQFWQERRDAPSFAGEAE